MRYICRYGVKAAAIRSERGGYRAGHHQGTSHHSSKIREQLGLLPHTEVEFQIAGDHAKIRKVARPIGAKSKGKRAVKALEGAVDAPMSTDEIMALAPWWVRMDHLRRGST